MPVLKPEDSHWLKDEEPDSGFNTGFRFPLTKNQEIL